MHTMDGIFSLPEATRADFLRSLVECFGCAYICLWQQPHDDSSPLSNGLFFLDGVYNETNNLSGSNLGSSISAAERLFALYQRLTFVLNDECVPGLAFRNQMPYLELQQLDLLRLASTVIQTQFYQEARIETAVFMGCNKGEIELGFSTVQIDIQTVVGTLFPKDFSRLSLPIDQNPPSSSSSSCWRTLSTGSPECSSLLFSGSAAPTSQSHFPETLPTPIPMQNQIIPTHHFPFPSPDAEQEAIIKAIIHVISSPPPPSSSTSAFKTYYNNRPDVTPSDNPRSRQSPMKRSIAFCRRLHLMRMRERFQFQAPRPGTSTSLHHTISERRRREKLNENFQKLRALLPPRTKKHKASILTAAHEALKSLIAEIEKLNMRNKQLAALLSSKEAASIIQQNSNNFRSSNERLNVQVSDVLGATSSSEERMVDLQVIVRGEICQAHIVIRLLEFLRRLQNVSFISMGANTHNTQGTPFTQINFTLGIAEASEWDEAAFQEAVRRVVADLTH